MWDQGLKQDVCNFNTMEVHTTYPDGTIRYKTATVTLFGRLCAVDWFSPFFGSPYVPA